MSNAKLSIGEKTYDLPMFMGTENEPAVDITKLRDQSGYVTLDNGYMNTGACTSAITFLDGEKGILKYRGIPIEQIAANASFLETSFLLLNGKLPNKTELENFGKKINSFSKVPEGLKNILAQYPKNSHPMGVLSAAVASLSCFYPENLDQDLSAEKKENVIAQMMAQVKAVSAYSYRYSQGKPLVESNPNLDFSSDFINMMFDHGGKVDPELAKALDVLLILHADHEQNCSTSTVRMVGSSKANLYASISAGVDALWGPLHGGANQAVLEMLEEIKNEGITYKEFLARVKDKQNASRLMGFGHRVYKNFDPRATIIKGACDTVLKKMGKADPLLDIARGLEEEALKDPYFVERKLYPNVDFYSGIIYRAMGIPTNMFTVMFAIGRLPGWMAQWKEMVEAPGMKICRPRQIYTGKVNQEFVDIAKR
ncbi:MAG: citrate synthase [Bacteriovoracaceae bacterium]